MTDRALSLLVAGAAAVDAGKTTFSVGLCRYVEATGFKPRAGNDYWEDHDDVLAATLDGRLYGKDAKRLAAASPGRVAPETVNPVHRLWLPTPGAGKGLLGRDGRAFAVDRVTDGGASRFVVNDTVDVPDVVDERLPLGEATAVESLPAFNEVMATLHKPAMASVGERIASTERAVVESYADIARPVEGFEPDAVAVVEPRRCRVYDGDRYARACEVASGSAHEGRLEERVERVVDYLEPRATVALPALASGERDAPEEHGYAAAYDALVRAAGR